MNAFRAMKRSEVKVTQSCSTLGTIAIYEFSFIVSIDMSLSKLQEIEKAGKLVCCRSWGQKESDTT